jgi:hypothetical protein
LYSADPSGYPTARAKAWKNNLQKTGKKRKRIRRIRKESEKKKKK